MRDLVSLLEPFPDFHQPLTREQPVSTLGRCPVIGRHGPFSSEVERLMYVDLESGFEAFQMQIHCAVMAVLSGMVGY